MSYFIGILLIFAGVMIGICLAGLLAGGKLAGHEAYLRQQLEIQGQEGRWNWEPYMHGLHNGLALALEQLTGEDRIKAAPEEWGRDTYLKSKAN